MQKPQVPGKPLQLDNTQQQSTCVSQVMLECKRKILYERGYNARIQMAVGYAECRASFPSLYCLELFNPYESSLEKTNFSRHLEASTHSPVETLCLLCGHSWDGAESA